MELNAVFWINIIQSILTIILHSLTIYIFCSITNQRVFHKVSAMVEISPSLNLYFFMQILTSFITIIYITFWIFMVSQLDSIINAYVWFCIFTLQKISFICLPLSVFAIGVDRCCNFLYPWKFKKSIIPVIFTFLSAFLFIVFTVLRIAPLMFPECDRRECVKYIGSDIYINIRYFTSAIILITCVILWILCRNKLHIHLAKNIAGRSNKVILSTLVATFIFDFLPHILIAIFAKIATANVVTYVGPISTTAGAFEAFICALIYRAVFKKKKFHGASTVAVNINF